MQQSIAQLTIPSRFEAICSAAESVYGVLAQYDLFERDHTYGADGTYR